MGQLHYPQKKRIPGPWMLSHSDFEELNDLIIRVSDILLESWINQITHEIYEKHGKDSLNDEEFEKQLEKRKKSDFRNEHHVDCHLITSEGTKLTDNSVIGLLKSSSLNDIAPTELHINVVHGVYYSHQFDLRISKVYNGSLNYEIECFDTRLKDDIQYLVDRWIESKKPSPILNFWSNFGDVFAFLSVPVLLFVLGMLLYPSTERYTEYESEIQSKANIILNNGVDSTNVNEAIQLLLESESNYIPDNFKRKQLPPLPKNSVYIKILIVTMFILIISLIRPKTTIGLGKMKNRVKYYDYWIKFVTISLPMTLVIPPIWDSVKEWLY